MKKDNKKQIILLVILGVVAVGMVGRSIMVSPGGSAAGSAKKDSLTTKTNSEGIVEFKSVFEEVNVNLTELMQNIKNVEFQYSTAQIARDPSVPIRKGDVSNSINTTLPPTGPSVTPDSLVYLAQLKFLTAIVYEEVNPMAVIDNQVVSVGYEFRETPDAEPILVKSIGVDFVVLSIPSEDQEVTKELIKEQ